MLERNVPALRLVVFFLTIASTTAIPSSVSINQQPQTPARSFLSRLVKFAAEL
jgi:hypothetical protein